MSKPSTDKGQVLKPEYAKLDESRSSGQTSEAKTLDRFQNDIHKEREQRKEQVVSAEQKQADQKQKADKTDNTEQSEQLNKPRYPLISGTEQNIKLYPDGSRVNVGHDKYAEKIQKEINKSKASSATKQEGRQISYPQAQPSYDAAGTLDHIDIMPNIVGKDKK